MLWLTSILRAIPISRGTRSQMGKKQAMKAAAKAGVTPLPEPLCSAGSTFTHVHWLFVPAPVLKIFYISFIPLLGLLLQQSSFQCLFSFLSSFCFYSQTGFHTTKVLYNLRACSQITACTLQTHSAAFLQVWAFLEQGVQCLLGRALYFVSLRHWCNKHDLPS